MNTKLDRLTKDTAPWIPMSNPCDIKHLGKLEEELNEAGAAIARCLIQGIDECEPDTGKPNKEWLEDELADVAANIELCKTRFKLDRKRMRVRQRMKKARLEKWHNGLEHDIFQVTTSYTNSIEGKSFLPKDWVEYLLILLIVALSVYLGMVLKWYLY